jgi:signal transduction histidine kinase
VQGARPGARRRDGHGFDEDDPVRASGGPGGGVLRVAQEALHNALRHSDADRVDVVLARRGQGAALTVTDNGKGFEPRTVRRAGRHLGLVSMRDRASGVGGRLRVRSAPGQGTTIEMEVPGG